MNVDSKYIKALVFSAVLIFGVLAFKPSVEKNLANVSVPQDATVLPDFVPQNQSVIVPEGDLTDNYIANAMNAKGEIAKWQSFPVSVYISDSYYKNIAEAAFNSYNNVFAGLLNFSFTDSPTNAQIKVTFTNRLENTDGDQFIAGTTNNFISGNNIQASNISILTEKNNTKLSSTQIFNTLLHEIGHAVGIIGHSQNKNDIMYSHTDSDKLQSLSARDLATIKIMYSNNEALINENKSDAASQKLEEAIKYANRVPDKTVSWINLGNVYYDLKMLPEALEAYKKALKIDPNDPNIYSSMASCYYESKKYSTAAQFYNYAIERTSDTVAIENFEYMKALSLLSGKYYPEAYSAYNDLIIKYPDKKEYLINYLYLCTQLNKPAGKDVLNSYLQRHPEDNTDANLIQYKEFYRVK